MLKWTQEIVEDSGFWLLTQNKILLVFAHAAYSTLIASRDLASFAFERVPFCKISFFPLGKCISVLVHFLWTLEDKVLFMFALKVSPNVVTEEMGIYNDTHLLTLMCVCKHFSVIYCFQETFPPQCPHLGLVPHSEGDPWSHRELGVLRVCWECLMWWEQPDAAEAALANGNITLQCTVTWDILERESLPYAVCGWGVTTMHNEPAATSLGHASCPVPLLLFIFSWGKLVAELVSTGQARRGT